ncbi:hypothetical protein L9F63_028359, partial [Diploptera punctata]
MIYLPGRLSCNARRSFTSAHSDETSFRHLSQYSSKIITFFSKSLKKVMGDGSSLKHL